MQMPSAPKNSNTALHQKIPMTAMVLEVVCLRTGGTAVWVITQRVTESAWWDFCNSEFPIANLLFVAEHGANVFGALHEKRWTVNSNPLFPYFKSIHTTQFGVSAERDRSRFLVEWLFRKPDLRIALDFKGVARTQRREEIYTGLFFYWLNGNNKRF